MGACSKRAGSPVDWELEITGAWPFKKERACAVAILKTSGAENKRRTNTRETRTDSRSGKRSKRDDPRN